MAANVVAASRRLGYR